MDEVAGQGLPIPGTLVVSLDFELFWGVLGRRSLDSYRPNLEGVHEAIPALLEAFRKHRIHATWAAVGCLLLDDFDEVVSWGAELADAYDSSELSSVLYAQRMARTAAGRDPAVRRCHFAPQLARMILATPNQELGTHTFSHFYCLESPRSTDAFAADLRTALAVARLKTGITPQSLVFPDNQYGPAHLEVARRVGIRAVRGTASSWLYGARSRDEERAFRRVGRLVDAYLPLTARRLSYDIDRVAETQPYDVAGTRFLRPWSGYARSAEALRLRHIEREMAAAAWRGHVYHLWWHPHNFGSNLKENLIVLERVLATYDELRDRLGMRSANMGEVAELAAAGWVGDGPTAKRTFSSAAVG